MRCPTTKTYARLYRLGQWQGLATSLGSRSIAWPVNSAHFVSCLDDFLHAHAQVGAVVVGHDRNINYHKIQYATLCIRENPGCHFIATNLDAVTHLTDAQVGSCELWRLSV